MESIIIGLELQRVEQNEVIYLCILREMALPLNELESGQGEVYEFM